MFVHVPFESGRMEPAPTGSAPLRPPPTPQGHRVAARDQANASSTACIRPSIAACYQSQQVETDKTHGGVLENPTLHS